MANLGSIAMLSEIDGLLPVDKPAGLAAHDLVKTVKRVFNLVKVGHGGTIDPAATGLFMLLLGDATRLSNGLMSADSTTVCTLALGKRTDTGDPSGRPLADGDASAVTPGAVEAALADFRGDIYQMPPAFSAVRRGEGPGPLDIVETPAAELRERFTHVYSIHLLACEGTSVTVEIAAGKGFSARAFARDFGETLGCGAMLASARRTKLGKYAVTDAVPFMDLLKLDAPAFKARVLPLSTSGLA